MLALLAAALLRFWALPQGVPFSVRVDEPEVMVRAVRMMKTGDFNPHFFDYPTLYMYVQAVVAVVALPGRRDAAASGRRWRRRRPKRSTSGDARSRRFSAPRRSGSSTAPRMRWGGRTALLAAVMLAVMPLHVRESHFVLTDVPATFFVMLTLLLSLRAHERATAWAFALAGAAAGLAGAHQVQRRARAC